MDKKFKKEKKTRHGGPDYLTPYPVSRLAPSISIVDLAKEIEQADQVLNTRVSAKLQVIADQIKTLQDQARSVLKEAHNDKELHKVNCRFKKIAGRIYHHYEKEDGTVYFSLLSPEDWKGKPPHKFKGSYRLEQDMSWTHKDRLNAPDDTKKLVKLLLEEDNR